MIERVTRGGAVAALAAVLCAASLDGAPSPRTTHTAVLLVRYDASAIRLNDPVVGSLEVDLRNAVAKVEGDGEVRLLRIGGGYMEGQPPGVYVGGFQFECESIGPRAAAERIGSTLERLLAAKLGGSQTIDRSQEMDLRAEITRLEAATAAIEAKMEGIASRRSEERRIQQLQDVRALVGQQMSAERASVKAMESRIAKSTSALDAATSEIAQLRSAIQSLSSNATENASQIAVLSAKLDDKAAKRDYVTAELEAATSELAKVRTTLISREIELRNKEQALVEAERDLNLVERNLDELRGQRQSLRASLEAAAVRYDVFRKRQEQSDVQVSIWSLVTPPSKD